MIRIRKKGLYRNKHQTEVDMYVSDIQEITAEHCKVRVGWVNRFYPSVVHTDTVLLPLKTLSDWTEIKEPLS